MMRSDVKTVFGKTGNRFVKTSFLPVTGLRDYGLCLQCFDAVGWAAGRASGL